MAQTKLAEAPVASLTESLRRHVEAAPSKRKLSRTAGVSPAVINRFRRAERTLTLATADRLAKALGLALVAGRD